MSAMETTINPELAQERKKATFDALQLTYLLYNGPQQTRRKRYLQSLAVQDPQIKNSPNWNTLSREEKHEEAIRKAIYIIKLFEELGITDDVERRFLAESIMPHEISPLGLHTSMFTPTIEKQGTDEQKKKWLPLCKRYEIIGTYGQTELGHGTFIRGLETTATYDPKTKEFIVDTPTLTSMKYWPGSLGKMSNYCLVMAQLITQGVKRGIQAFMVPIRSLDNHQPLPGVTVGDIGTKFGYNAMDNGFLRLNKVRIPRENMLMRYAKVLEDGTFIQPENDKLMYGTMVFIRSVIVIDCARSLAQGVTIAVRYSAVRRQSEGLRGGEEAQIIDYQTQQHKLFGPLAMAYALWIAGRYMVDVYVRVTKQIDAGLLEELPQLHGMSAGLKAFSSAYTAEMLETLRMSCGGHGFSNGSGFAKIYGHFIPSCTYEGENTVMFLQTARYLMKCYTQVKQGHQQASFLSYLNEPLGGSSSINSDLDLSSLLAIYNHRALRLIDGTSRRIQRLVTSGKPAMEAANLSGVQLVKAAKGHCHAICLKFFVDKVNNSQLNADAHRVFQTLCRLYAVYGITENIGEFMQDGYLSSTQAEMLNDKLVDLLAEIRPNAVALVDAFDFPDNVLDSALGRYDGNVYEAMYEYALKSRLNETEVSEGYYKYLKPFIESQKNKSKSSAVAARL